MPVPRVSRGEGEDRDPSVEWGLACWAGRAKRVTSSWIGTHHVLIALTSQGEPGADGAAGKEVPFVLTCPFPVGVRLRAPGLAPPRPLSVHSVTALSMQTVSGQIYGAPCPGRSGERSWAAGREGESGICFSLFFF